MTGHDAVVERGLIEERRGKHDKGVEPAPSLVEPLGDEIGGETLLEALLDLERLVDLAYRHGAGFEPTVQHLGHSCHGALTRRTGEGHLIDDVLV